MKEDKKKLNFNEYDYASIDYLSELKYVDFIFDTLPTIVKKKAVYDGSKLKFTIEIEPDDFETSEEWEKFREEILKMNKELEINDENYLENKLFKSKNEYNMKDIANTLKNNAEAMAEKMSEQDIKKGYEKFKEDCNENCTKTNKSITDEYNVYGSKLSDVEEIKKLKAKCAKLTTLVGQLTYELFEEKLKELMEDK